MNGKALGLWTVVIAFSAVWGEEAKHDDYHQLVTKVSRGYSLLHC